MHHRQTSPSLETMRLQPYFAERTERSIRREVRPFIIINLAKIFDVLVAADHRAQANRDRYLAQEN